MSTGSGDANYSHVYADIVAHESHDTVGASQNSNPGLCSELLEGSVDFNTENKARRASLDARVTSLSLNGLSYEALPSSFLTPSALSLADAPDTNHLTKLERINQLLAEAAKLQQEVFG